MYIYEKVEVLGYLLWLIWERERCFYEWRHNW